MQGGDTPLLTDFENSYWEGTVGTYVLGTALTANLFDKSGNFYNYWGMSEVYRSQRFIDMLNRAKADCGCK